MFINLTEHLVSWLSVCHPPCVPVCGAAVLSAAGHARRRTLGQTQSVRDSRALYRQRAARQRVCQPAGNQQPHPRYSCLAWTNCVFLSPFFCLFVYYLLHCSSSFFLIPKPPLLPHLVAWCGHSEACSSSLPVHMNSPPSFLPLPSLPFLSISL